MPSNARAGLLFVFLLGLLVGAFVQGVGDVLPLPSRGWFGETRGTGFFDDRGGGTLGQTALILVVLLLWGLPRRLRLWGTGMLSESMVADEHGRADLAWILVVHGLWTGVFAVAEGLRPIFDSMCVEIPRATSILLGVAELVGRGQARLVTPALCVFAGLFFHRWLYTQAVWSGRRWRVVARAWRPAFLLVALLGATLSWSLLWEVLGKLCGLAS